MKDVRAREVAVPFLQKLVAADTCNPPGNEHGLAVIVRDFLLEHGLEGTISPVAPGRSNLELVLKGGSGRTLMFCGHLDTVSAWTAEAGKYPPHGAVIESGRMYGRGTADMKSGLAAMLLAAVSLHQEGVTLGGDLILLATAGEEVDSCGARHYADRQTLQNIGAIVIAEPTAGKVAVGHKGALWLRITLHGRSAHGSMPQLGLNSVEGMAEIIALLHRHALQWQARDAILGTSSLSVNKITGGVQTNVIPDRCTIEVDIRTVPPLKHAALLQEITEQLEAIRERHSDYRYEVEQLLDRSVVLTDPGHELIRMALELAGDTTGGAQGVSYYTDASVLHDDGRLPVLIYGPGEPGQAHQPDEWVDIEAYLQSISFYRELALRYLGV